MTPLTSSESKASAFSSFSKMPTKSSTKPAGFVPSSVVLVGPVDAGDGLQQHVVAHRLVEVHAVEDRRVEAGQQLLGDDQDLRLLVRLRKALRTASLVLVGDLVLAERGRRRCALPADRRPREYSGGR